MVLVSLEKRYDDIKTSHMMGFIHISTQKPFAGGGGEVAVPPLA